MENFQMTTIPIPQEVEYDKFLSLVEKRKQL